VKRKLIYIGCFLLFGIGVGFISVWFDNNTDTIFFVNIPGTVIGDGIYSGTIKLFGDPASSQAHYTIPWIFRIPQVYVLASGVFWGLLGAIFAFFVKLKVVLRIIGVYVLILIILAILFYAF
jgi:hypothetical protein